MSWCVKHVQVFAQTYPNSPTPTHATWSDILRSSWRELLDMILPSSQQSYFDEMRVLFVEDAMRIALFIERQRPRDNLDKWCNSLNFRLHFSWIIKYKFLRNINVNIRNFVKSCNYYLVYRKYYITGILFWERKQYNQNKHYV